MIAATQLLLYFFLFEPILQYMGYSPSLNYLQFGLLSLSTILIAAGGYIINDVNDIEIDKINKPGKNMIGIALKRSNAMIMYYTITTIGIIIGVYLSVVLREQYLSLVNVFCAAMLWWYAVSLKRTILLGNILVALMIAASIVVVYLFEPRAYSNEVFYYIIAAYASFAFIINLARELIKDLEDVAGDKEHHAKTLAVVSKPFVSKAIISLLITLLISTLSYFQYLQIVENEILVFMYITFLIQIPLLLLLIFIWVFNTTGAYHRLGIFTKLIMLSGVLSILLFYKLFIS
ncbi:MAG: UbiA family prenyltransferase [Bacteroidia bacterium]|nr:UbiA family prenyltransferase [Bacteroidia bacterium]